MLSHVVLTSLLTAASAHQNFHQFWVNDVSPGYEVAIRMPPSNSPVTDVTSDDITCNVNGNIVPSGVSTATANEGDSIKVQWDSSSHPGPITHFLFGPVTNASLATGVGSWVKIDEFDSENGTWANAIMEAQDMTYTFNLPTGLTSGDYLLRSEMLALHGAQTIGGAQFYIGCAQLTITGTAGESCSPSIELPGAYNETADDIYIPNIYNGFNISTYTAPGGPVATCGSGSGSASATVISSSVVATSAAASSVSSASAAEAASTSVVASSEFAVSSSIPVTTSAANIAAATITNGTASTSKSKSACKAKTTGGAYLNATISAPTATKSKSACKVKSKTSSAFALSSASLQVAAIQSSSTFAPTTFQTVAASTSSAPTSTSTASAESAPAGTTLDNLLAWISSFYSANKGTSYTGETSA